MKYVAHIPLIGGFALANMNVVKKPPIAITSYSAFGNNDKLFLRYLQKKNIRIPYFELDKLNEGQKKSIQELIGKIDFVSGVPPCSGLSMSGNLKAGERATAPANDWMYLSAEFVLGQLRPTVYVFENAPTLYTNAGETVRNKLMEIARYHGYAGTFYKTDTLLHGIPQKRPRTYTILLKGENAPILNYFNKETPSTAEYLKNIPKDATLQDSYYAKEVYIKDFEITRFLKIKYGDNWRQSLLETRDHVASYDFLVAQGLIEEFKEFLENDPDAKESILKDTNHVIKKVGMGKNFRLSHRVLILDKHHVYSVIGEMMERNIHPTEDRRINMREYMHLMGMPHDFDLYDTKEFAKLPQNVPVTTSEDITREVIAIINGKRKLSLERFNYQNNIQHDHIKSKTKSLW